MPKLTDFTVLTFDCYGTLIDWESGMIEALKPLTSRVGRALTRNQILETHGRIEGAQQRITPAKNYRLVLATVYKRMAEEWGVNVAWEECLAYGRSVGDWPAFEDTAAALQYLKKFYKLVILSNVDNESFALSNRKLGVQFDAICTAEDIGSYKPASQNFEYLLAHLGALGIERTQVLHTAESLFHDHGPANKFGLASCWIYRRHAQEGFGATRHPGDMPRHEFRFNSMGEMAASHRQHSGG